jgi:hypothetical protein
MKKRIIEPCNISFPLRWLSSLSGTVWLRLKLDSCLAGFHFNHDIADKERTLSYSYCIFLATSFLEVVTEGLDLVEAYKLKYSFEPYPLATYFFEQGGNRLAGEYHREEVHEEDTHTFCLTLFRASPRIWSGINSLTPFIAGKK